MFKSLRDFYTSDEWQAFRQILIDERTADDGLIYDEYTGLPIIKAYDIILHHKIPLTDDNVNDYSISLNPDNIMIVSFKSHNIIHQRFEGYVRRVYLVYGSPCAGKSTWVNDVAYDDDLIIDVDKIWEAICLSDRLHKPRRLVANALGVRDCLIDMVKQRKGMWRNAYVIGTYPLATDRQRMINLLGAEPIFIDCEKDLCLSRAPNDEWKEFVEDWFDSYTA